MDLKKLQNDILKTDEEVKYDAAEKNHTNYPTDGQKKRSVLKTILIAFAAFLGICVLIIIWACLLPDDNDNSITEENAIEVQEETEAEDLAEPERTPKEEAKEAAERKKIVEDLAQTEPYEGMDAEYIDCTSCGAHDYDENAAHGNEDEYDLLCYWHTRDTTSLERKQFLRVYIKAGKVVKTQNWGYRKEDGSLDMDAILEDRKDNKKLLSGDEEVDNAWTGKEYADSKLESFMEAVNQDEKYQALDNDSKKAIAWCKALDYWLEKKEAEHYDVEQYYEAIRNSKK